MKISTVVSKGFVYLLSVLFFACGSNYEHDYTEEQIFQEVKKYIKHPRMLEKKGIKITEFLDYPPFEDVSLKLLTENVRFILGKNNLEFDIRKFNLGEKTVAENETGFKLNKGGQSLGIVTNKGEFTKYYSERIERDFDKGETYFLAFLSRSYGISLKSPESYALFKVNTTEVSGDLQIEKTKKFLCITNPLDKDMYNKNSKILLDFFLANLKLKEEGNYLIVKINDIEFKLDKWSPYIIEGLDYGSYEIDVKVFNKEGKELEGILGKNTSIQIEVKEETVFE